MKILNKLKINIATILIVTLMVNQSTFAGRFFFDNGKVKFADDNGKIATGWRWLDTNGDGIAECYRFSDTGELATTSRIKDKQVNKDGKWVVDGIVQQIYLATGKPLYASNAGFGLKDTNTYLDLGTESTTKRINASKIDVKNKMEKDAKIDELNAEEYKKSLVGPEGVFERPENGQLITKAAKKKMDKRPVATQSEWKILDMTTKEDEAVVITTGSVVGGRDCRRFVDSSSKYTAKVDSVKVYGGYVWEDVICLQGNGAYVKFKTTDNQGFQANYMEFEVAHQTHGESTSDTFCSLEVLLNSDSVGSFEDFQDSEPEKVEIWLDNDEAYVTLKAFVTGDAPGRKIYIRNARFRRIRVKE